MVTVVFNSGDRYANNYSDLDQYDYGQVLRIQGLNLPPVVEVHFAVQETGGTSITRLGIAKDGVTDVPIPDSLLENGDAEQNYSIYAFVYLTDATSGKTKYRAKLDVNARPKPEVPGGADNPDIFHEAVLTVRESAEKAEEAQKQAEGYAHGREDLPERAEDNAMYYARKASEDAQRTAEDRTEVERLTESNAKMQGEVKKDLEEVKKISSQAQTSATNAALSEQKSEEAATRAETAQTGAETAEGNAELAAQKTGQDKTTVEQAKKLVEQIGQEVLGNKDAVDKTTQDFALTAQRALADVNNAGQIQTERVQTAGTNAVEGVKTAQNTATKAVEDKGKEVLQSLPDLETQIDAKLDKNQGAEHTGKALVVGEDGNVVPGKLQTEGVGDAADAIINTATGNLLLIKDSAERKNKGFGMAGKTEQFNTRGINLWDLYSTVIVEGTKYVMFNNPIQAGTYTLPAILTNNKSAKESLFSFYNAQNQSVGSGNIEHGARGSETITLTGDAVKVLFYAGSAHDSSQGVTTTIKDIQLETGNTTTAYEPYTGRKSSPSPEYPQEIINCGEWREDIQKYAVDVKVTGKNLFNKDKIKVINANLCTTEYKDDIVKIITATNRSNSAYAILTNGVKLKAGKTYKVSVDIVGGSKLTPTLSFFVAGKIGSILTRNDTYTPDTDIEIDIGVYLKGTNIIIGDALEITNVMLEISDTPTAYEPYKEQTLTLTSDRPITKWDKLVEQDGQIGWLYNGKEYTAKGDEQNISGYETYYTGESTNLGIVIPDNDLIEVSGYANRLTYEKDVWSKIHVLEGYSFNGKNQIHIRIPNDKIGVENSAGKEERYKAMKAYLKKEYEAGTPYTFLYRSSKSEFLPLPQEQQDAIRALSTYYPTTVVINSEDMEMELSYIADTKNFILGIAENFAQKQLETNRLILERTI